MRTTLTIDDQIARRLKEAAHRSGKSFKEVVNETLRKGLIARQAMPQIRPYRIEPSSLGAVRSGVDLDQALQLADRLEDAEVARKLQMKK